MVARDRAAASVRALLRAGVLLLPLLSGCHGITDYSSEYSYAVTILRAEDLSVEGTITGVDGGRAMLSLGQSEFLVLSYQGKIYRINRPDMEISDVIPVGQTDASGYHSMTRLPNGRVYFIGAYGEVIEFAPDVGLVIDQFSGGLSPTSICKAVSGDTFYVADSHNNTIREFWAEDNTVTREIQLPDTPVALAPHEGLTPGLYVLAVCFVGDYAYVLRTDGTLTLFEFQMGFHAWDVVAMSNSTYWCIVCPEYGSDLGGVDIVEGPPRFWSDYYLRLGGHPTCVCAQSLGSIFYVAGEREEGGGARVFAVDPVEGEIVDTADLPGIALDIIMHANDEYVVVLTSTE